MKILIVHEIFPPEISGGGEKLILRLAKSLKKRGHKVKVICSGNPKIKKHKGIETVRIPVNRYGMNLMIPEIARHAREADVI
ncbi:MAG: glycosyltransferase, partial [Planctomycetota bacterium]